jgi:hypothetical protein
VHIIPVPQKHLWPQVETFMADFVALVHDSDEVWLKPGGRNELSHRLELCTTGLPCDLSVSGPGTLWKSSMGSIKCIQLDGCNYVILNDLFLRCQGNTSGDSAIYVDGSYLYIENSSLSDCASDSDGGFVQSYHSSLVEIKDSIFVNGFSEGFGGAISGVGSNLSIASSKFLDCRSVKGGGAISMQVLRCYGATPINSFVVVDSTIFSDCYTDGRGGAISSESGGLVLSHSQFSKCHSADSGGSLSLTQVFDGKISASIFEDCAADGLGGGAIFIQHSNAFLVGVQSWRNKARYGGGGFLLWNGTSPPAILGWCAEGTYGVIPESSREDASPLECAFCSKGKYQSGFGMTREKDCIKCKSGEYSVYVGTSVCLKCPAGTFSLDNQTVMVSCVACPPGKYSHEGFSVCFFCGVGTYNSEESASQCNICESGKYNDALGAVQECKICVKGKYSPMGASECLLCSVGKYASSDMTEMCTDCDAGKFLSSTGGSSCLDCSQINCSAGKYLSACSNQSDALCFTCIPGKFLVLEQHAFCSWCPSGTYSADGIVCLDCAPGKFSVARSQGIISHVPAIGHYLNDEYIEWVIAPAGASVITIQFTLLDTELSFDNVKVLSYIAEGNSPEFTESELGSYSGKDLPAAIKVSAGIVKIIWSSDESNCDLMGNVCPWEYKGWALNWISLGLTACELCPAGMYSSWNRATACGECEPGTFSVKVNTSACSQCASVVCGKGQYTLSCSSTRDTSCVPCMPGTYQSRSLANASVCDLCPAGKYSSMQGAVNSDVCSLCEGGTNAAVPGSRSCELCMPGSYSLTGSVTCFPCPSDTHSMVLFGSLSWFPTSNDETIQWLIVSPAAVALRLEFLLFDSEQGHDNLTVFSCFDVECKASKQSWVFSGHLIPPPIKIEQRAFKFIWSSDGAGLSFGWKVNWTGIGAAGSSFCSGLHESSDFRRESEHLRNEVSKAVQEVSYNSAGTWRSYLEGSTGTQKQIGSVVPYAKRQKLIDKSVQRNLQIFHWANSNLTPAENSCNAKFNFLSQNDDLWAGQWSIGYETRNTDRPSFAARRLIGDMSARTQAIQVSLCGEGNAALYGPCMASTAIRLDTVGIPSMESPAYPGLPFSVTVMKVDFYNQTVVTDSSSLIKVKKSSSSLLYTLVSPILSLESGIAIFSISIRPFFYVSLVKQSASVVAAPSLSFEGVDSDSYLDSNVIRSSDINITLSSQASICPLGYVLELEMVVGLSSVTSGACKYCRPGKYSVNPLAGEASGPACLTCPAGGSCVDGGFLVTFNTGMWVIRNGMYILVSCPSGHQLVNSVDGFFNHDVQRCKRCKIDEYILNSSDPEIGCQSCPTWARCNSSEVTPIVKGSEWTDDLSRGVKTLIGCPSRYELVGQECNLCPASHYCTGNSTPKLACPENEFAPPGSSSINDCTRSQSDSSKVLGGSIAAVIVAILAFALAGVILVRGKRESPEERQLRLAVDALRKRLEICKEHGYLLSSEKRFIFHPSVTHGYIRQTYAEAAARLWLGQDFDLHQFDLFCLCLEEAAAGSTEGRSFLRRLQSDRYALLCQWLLEFSSTLIRMDVADGGEIRTPAKKPGGPALQSEHQLGGAEGMHFFVHKVAKARIWRDDPELFRRLQAKARHEMDKVFSAVLLRIESDEQ